MTIPNVRGVERVLACPPTVHAPAAKLNFGVAGIPKKANLIDGLLHARKVAVDVIEIKFTRGIHISAEEARYVNAVAKKQGLILTCHAPFSIDLGAPDVSRLESREVLYQAAVRAAQCGARSIVFHGGRYHGQDQRRVHARIKDAVKDIVRRLGQQRCRITLRPEVRKDSEEWGTFKEIIDLSTEVDGVLPCLNFGHLYRRSFHEDDILKTFRSQLRHMARRLGKESLKDVHIHIVEDSYTREGSDKHVMLQDSFLKYKELLEIWEEFEVKGNVICYTPHRIHDALLLRRIWERTFRKFEHRY